MQIQLQQLQPVYLEKEKLVGSEIWNNQQIFESGSLVEIVAASGRGKSSFIHFLYGLRNDYRGKISLEGGGPDALNYKQTALLRTKKLSIVFQDLKLFESATCLQNILVKNALTGFSSTDAIEAMAERLGVRNKLAAMAGNCSYGERQRIAIIRALQQPFEMLLLDEPFSHLDEMNREKALDLILEETKKQNAGIVLADLETNPSFPATKRLKL